MKSKPSERGSELILDRPYGLRIDGHGMMDVIDTGRRRRFSGGETVRIIEESLSGPNLARATAQRYGNHRSV